MDSDGTCKNPQVSAAARVSHFFDAETCEFSQVPSLSWASMGLYLNLNVIN